MIALVLKKLPGMALCSQSDPEQWFPKGEHHPERSDEGVQATAQAQRAKAICGRCPVKAACLAEAMEHKIDHGIWGGLTVRERRALRKRLAK